MASYSTTFNATENPISESGAFSTMHLMDALQTNGSTCYPTTFGGNDCGALYVGASIGASQYSQGTLNDAAIGFDSGAGVRLNNSSDSDGYYAFADLSDGTIHVNRIDDDGSSITQTLLAQFGYSGGVGTGSVIGIRAIGPALHVLKDGNITGTTTDSNYLSGNPWIESFSVSSIDATKHFTAWEGGDYTPTYPIYDTVTQSVRTGTTNPYTFAHAGGGSNMTLLVSTTFAGDENPLSEGGVWDTPGAWPACKKVSGNLRVTSGATDCLARYIGTTPDGNHWCEVTLAGTYVSTTANWAACTRMQSDGACYYLTNNASSNRHVQLYRVAAGDSFTNIGAFDTGTTLVAGDKLRLESVGSTHRIYKNGVLQTSFTDSNLTGGTFGTGAWTASGSQNTDIISDWAGGNTTAADVLVKGVAVAAMHGVSSTDHVTAVTYGGVALTRQIRATDTATELGAAEWWFLGSGVPQGSQIVSITNGTTTDDIEYVCVTFLGSTDLEIIDTDSINGNTANPQTTMNYGGRRAISIAAIYSGLPSPSDLGNINNCFSLGDGRDYGAFCSKAIGQPDNGTSDFTIGFTSSTDDVAFVAITIAEVQAAFTPVDPMGVTGVFGI